MNRFGMTMAAACLVAGLARPALAAGNEQQNIVDGAVSAVAAMKAETGFAKSGLLARAKAVLIIPRSVSAAVGVGGEAGQAVLVVHTARGWSDPAFYTVAAASAGLQIGGKETTSVLLVMTDRALKAFLQDSNVTVGAQANVTAAQYDANRIAQLGGADTVLWSHSSGVFAGGAIEAQGFSQSAANDQAYYGQAVTAAQLANGAGKAPGAAKLRAAL